MTTFTNIVSKASDLQTTYEDYRAGFLNQALEKNRRSEPYIKEAYALKAIALELGSPEKLLTADNIKKSLLLASGVSEKASKIISEEDKIEAINNLIEKFLKPAGESYADELVFRYLIFKGDSFGGSMRNITGKLAKEKLLRAIISSLRISDIKYKWARDVKKKTITWIEASDPSYPMEQECKALCWEKDGSQRILIMDFSFNITGQRKEENFKNNVDICLFESSPNEPIDNLKKMKDKVKVLGELKGGIDPAGADEHWKTAKTALDRIRRTFENKVDTIYIGSAIEERMAEEIFGQLLAKELSFAANLNHEIQLANAANWLIGK